MSSPGWLTLRHAMALVAAVAFGAAALGIPGRATYGMRTSGDEPHYLLTAISLGEDGDLDVSDEITADRYRPFHERGLEPQSAEQPDGSMVVPHDPMLPALLAGPMLLGGFVGAKLALATAAGALGALLVWVMVRRFEVRIGVATVTAVVFACAAPLAVYGQQVYPEVPAALAVLVAVAALTGRMRQGAVLVLGAAVVALPWLSVKYVFVAAALAATGLVQLWRRGDRRAAAALAAGLGLAGFAYVVAHLAWYGGLTAYASGRFFQANGGELSVVGTHPDYLGRARRLVGLWVDRGFGLAAWQPAWLLAVPAVAALARRRPRGWGGLLAPLAAGWFTATFVALTMHGWWFAGRQTVVVLPLAAAAIGWWADRSLRRTWAVAVLGAVGIGAYVWVAFEAARGDVTWVVDFASTANPSFRGWTAALPDYLRPGLQMWALHGAWTVALGALAAWGWTSAGGLGGRLGPGVRGRLRPRLGPGTGSRPRTRAVGGLAASVQFSDPRAVVGATRGDGEDEEAGGERSADSQGWHRGTSLGG